MKPFPGKNFPSPHGLFTHLSKRIECINMYRHQSSPTFKEKNCHIGSRLGLLSANLINRHYEISPLFKGEGPLAMLSERERQVCQGVLLGQKVEAIALQLEVSANTVNTYKKKAYEKLGIHSRTALFSLCR